MKQKEKTTGLKEKQSDKPKKIGKKSNLKKSDECIQPDYKEIALKLKK